MDLDERRWGAGALCLRFRLRLRFWCRFVELIKQVLELPEGIRRRWSGGGGRDGWEICVLADLPAPRGLPPSDFFGGEAGAFFGFLTLLDQVPQPAHKSDDDKEDEKDDLSPVDVRHGDGGWVGACKGPGP